MLVVLHYLWNQSVTIEIGKGKMENLKISKPANIEYWGGSIGYIFSSLKISNKNILKNILEI